MCACYMLLLIRYTAVLTPHQQHCYIQRTHPPAGPTGVEDPLETPEEDPWWRGTDPDTEAACTLAGLPPS
jgi:hypothetical protein